MHFKQAADQDALLWIFFEMPHCVSFSPSLPGFVVHSLVLKFSDFGTKLKPHSVREGCARGYGEHCEGALSSGVADKWRGVREVSAMLMRRWIECRGVSGSLHGNIGNVDAKQQQHFCSGTKGKGGRSFHSC